LIRDRLAIALVSLMAGALPLLATVAVVGSTRRDVDVVALWFAGLLVLGLALTWVFIPKLPKWIIGGFGLILVAAGIGFTIAAPIADQPLDGNTTPWALVGLVIAGIVTIAAGVIHSDGKRY
jgi:hypothetical protein